MEDIYIYHHGVKGMKWGVRKARPTTGKKTYKQSKGNKIARDGLTRNSLLTGAEIVTEIASRLLVSAYPPSAPAVIAGKVVVKKVLSVAKIVNLSATSTAALVSDVNAKMYNKKLDEERNGR